MIAKVFIHRSFPIISCLYNNVLWLQLKCMNHTAHFYDILLLFWSLWSLTTLFTSQDVLQILHFYSVQQKKVSPMGL